MSEWTPPPEFDGYRVVGPLGRGGMGRVFLGHDVLLERAVAVKFIASVEPGTQSRERFFLEARAIARLSHPNVVTVYRVGEVQGHPYLVAEFIRGQSLSVVTKPLPSDRVLEVGLGLARGLAAAHRQGVLHRDIKPSNVVLSDSGEVKLLDFGLAKLIQSDADRPSTGPRRLSPTDSTATLNRLEGGTGFTQSDVVLGTPRYMAPEVLLGDAATRRSDVFSLGAVLFELCTGQPPERGSGHAVAPLRTVVPNIAPRLAAAVDRCLALDPVNRFASADQLLDALEDLKRGDAAALSTEGNPYRGLRPFEAEHQSLFFGREVETRAVLERLRSDPLVVVAGDSGVGKSSLCRAGVMPLVVSGALGEGRTWVTAQCVPGRTPVMALARVLAPIVETNEEALGAWISTESSAVARAFQQLRQRRPEIGLVIFVDQAEELFTLASANEATLTGQSLAALTSTPAVRVLVAIRGDFVTRLATLGALGEEASHSLYLLRPLTEENLRQVVVGPARARGVAFETDAMVETLVASARTAPGGLPLLQFALAELWDARDLEQRLIRAVALEAMGGVQGGLARHADTVVAGLSSEQRAKARRILLRLVTAEGTRARRTSAELGTESGAAKEALDALVNGRLVVVRDLGNGATCELAHEALVEGWGTLRDWLAAAAEERRIRERLDAAAAEWERLGKSPDALWHHRQLSEASRLDVSQLDERGSAFLAASRRAAMRTRVLRVLILASGPLLFASALAGSQIRARHQLTARVDEHVRAGSTALAQARRADAQSTERAQAAFALYDGTVGKPPGSLPSPADVKWDEAEAEWARARALQSEADLGYVQATQLFEAGLLLDGRRRDASDLRGEALYARLTLAERRHKSDLAAELTQQLLTSDPQGPWAKLLRLPGKLELSTDPPTATVTLERYVDEAGHLRRSPVGPVQANQRKYELAPGSYRMTLQAPGRAQLRYPFLIERNGSISLGLRLPVPSEVPPGFVYIAPGAFLFGSADDESLRLALDAPPLHEVHAGGYLVAQDEFTFGEWLAAIEALPANLATKLTPGTASDFGSVSVHRTGRSGWELAFSNGTQLYRSGPNNSLTYRGRSRNITQNWMRFPVLGVSPANVLGFAATGATPLRLCSEHEWERAARGADGRSYAGGNSPPKPTEADFDLSYGRVSEAFGPDEVGRYPDSDSPFDIHDVQGNAFEIVGSARPGVRAIEKGGAWYADASFTGRLARHGPLDMNSRSILLGVRWCMDLR
jgi:formylglycine-generating enzyme required for sulfatase activity